MIDKQTGHIPAWMGRESRNDLRRAFRNGGLDKDEYLDGRVRWEDVVGMKVVREICK